MKLKNGSRNLQKVSFAQSNQECLSSHSTSLVREIQECCFCNVTLCENCSRKCESCDFLYCWKCSIDLNTSVVCLECKINHSRVYIF